MGKLGEPGTCVDKDFKVCGLDRLRVVDMSVAPLLPRYALYSNLCNSVHTHHTVLVHTLNLWHTSLGRQLLTRSTPSMHEDGP